MFDIDKWQEIWITITRNKMRSMLTAFGVFWGIFMLVIMSGAGWGLENGIMSGVKDFAHNSCYFFTKTYTFFTLNQLTHRFCTHFLVHPPLISVSLPIVLFPCPYYTLNSP